MQAAPGSFLATIGAAGNAALLASGTVRSVRADTTLLLEGEPAGRVVVVHEGLVKITATHIDGNVAVLGIRGPGELVGELAALDGQPRSATATAITPATVRFLTVEDFERLVASHPDIALELIRMLSARLRASDAQRVEFAGDGVERRLARALLQLSHDYGELVDDGSIRIGLPFTQEDLAGSVGASRDAVAKALTSWRRQGLVTTGRRRIVLSDPARLSRLHRL